MATEKLALRHHKRLKKVVENPNPLFCQWLEEWRQEAVLKQNNLQYVYSKALSSLRKYPLPMSSGMECKILQGFGDKLCKQLDAKLTEYKEENPDYVLPPTIVVVSSNQPKPNLATKAQLRKRTKKAIAASSLDGIVMTSSPGSANEAHSSQSTSSNRKRPYAPKVGSSAYALLVTLAEKEEEGSTFMSKDDLIAAAQPLCEASFLIPPPGSRYTGWSSMGSLLSKGLTKKEGNPPRYSLTEDGRLLARRLAKNRPDKHHENMSDEDKGLEFLKSQGKFQVDYSCPSYQDSETAYTDTAVRHVMVAENPVICLDDESSNSTDAVVTTNHQLNSQLNSQGLSVFSNSQDEAIVLDDEDDEMMICDPVMKSPEEPTNSISSVNAQKSNLVKSDVRMEDSSDSDDGLFIPLAERLKRSSAQLKDVENAVAHDVKDCAELGVIVGGKEDNNDLEFFYVDEFYNETVHREEAYIDVIENFGVAYRIIAEKRSVSSFTGLFQYDTSGKKPKSDLVCYALLHENDAPEESSGGIKRKSVTLEKVSTADVPSSSALEDPSAALAFLEKKQQPVPSQLPKAKTVVKTVKRKAKDVEKDKINGSSNENVDPGVLGSTSSTFTFQELKDVPLEKCLSYSPLNRACAVASSVSECTEQVTLRPRCFQVVLCVDNCESVGGAEKSRKLLLVPALEQAGISVDVRKLNVGDFLWIAKSSFGEELVLDWIIERKRVDDLAKSIKDGRYREQKYRLCTSGVKRKVYLVEEFGKVHSAAGIGEKALFQSVVNTLVVDDFFIIKTAGQKETVQYLVSLTKQLQKYYSSQTLRSCTKDESGKLPWHYMTFKEFNETSIKRKRITIRQMFMRHLMQIRGLSLEKAMAITDRYPTPVSLMRAYHDIPAEDEKSRYNLLAKLKCPVSGRNVGPVLSKTVCMLYTSNKL